MIIVWENVSSFSQYYRPSHYTECHLVRCGRHHWILNTWRCPVLRCYKHSAAYTNWNGMV